MNAIGLQKSDLIKPKISLRAANTTGMEILGGVFKEIMVSQEGNSISSRQLCYVTKGLDNLLLSCECYQSLGSVQVLHQRIRGGGAVRKC